MSEAPATLRLATAGDARAVWRINNEPSVRAQSIRTGDIPWSDHERWYAGKLDDDACRLLVAELDGAVVGVVRFDLDVPRREALISVALASAARGRGIGAWLIDAGTGWLFERHDDLDRVLAKIRESNGASVAAFTRARYAPAGGEPIDGVPYVVRVRARES